MGCGGSGQKKVAPGAAVYASLGVPHDLRKRRQTTFDPVYRALTVKQLQKLSMFVKQALMEGDIHDPDESSPTYGRRVTWENVTIGQVHQLFVMPLIARARCSYMEIVSKVPEKTPDFCVIHRWDQNFRVMMAIISHHAKVYYDLDSGRQLGERQSSKEMRAQEASGKLGELEKAYWISAFSLNNVEVSQAEDSVISVYPADQTLPFARALRHKSCRGTLTILETFNTFGRSWVLLEEWVASKVKKSRDLGSINMSNNGGPVVLVDRSKKGDGPWVEVGKPETLSFPPDAAAKNVKVGVRGSQASSVKLQESICHILAGSDPSEPPTEYCDAYNQLEERARKPLQGRALCQAVLEESPEALLRMIQLMPKALNEVVPKLGAPVHVAAEQNNKQQLRVLLDMKASPGIERPEDGAGPLYIAAVNNATSVVRMLLDEGASVNHVRKLDQASALHAACYEATNKCVSILISERADLNCRRGDGATPAHIAAECNSSENLHNLIAAQADPNLMMVGGNPGATPLHLACIGGHNLCVGILLQAHANPNQALALEGQTPVILCVEHNQKQCLQKLLDSKASTDGGRMSDGFTALHVAVDKEQQATVKMLLDDKCNVNAQAHDGQSPLCLAARKGSVVILRQVIQAKGDVNQVSMQGWGPLDYAEKSDNTECANLIKGHRGAAHRPPSPMGMGGRQRQTSANDRSGFTVNNFLQEQKKGITLTIVHARGIRLSDVAGFSDPYVICEVCYRKGGHKKFQTKVCKGTLSPDWNHQEHLDDFQEGDSLKFEIWDKDAMWKPDDFLGAARLRSEQFYPQGFDSDIPLSKNRNVTGHGQGALRIRITVP